jgi:hypothetical protein
MRRQQAESYPPLEQRWFWSAVEPANVVSPVTKAAQGERETAAKCFGHGFECGNGITAPVDGELLASCLEGRVES